MATAKVKRSENRVWLEPLRKTRLAVNGVVMTFENHNSYRVRIRIPEPKRSK